MNGGAIKDEYNLDQATDSIKDKILADNDEDDVDQNQGDFLKIYQKDENGQREAPDEGAPSEIRYK